VVGREHNMKRRVRRRDEGSAVVDAACDDVVSFVCFFVGSPCQAFSSISQKIFIISCLTVCLPQSERGIIGNGH